jgi:hypothetical protein
LRIGAALVGLIALQAGDFQSSFSAPLQSENYFNPEDFQFWMRPVARSSKSLFCNRFQKLSEPGELPVLHDAAIT